MAKDEQLKALREATVAESEMMSPPYSLEEARRADGSRKPPNTTGARGGASLTELVEGDTSRLVSDRIDATINKHGL
ncbi:hypothetical protein OJ997_22895 [Solirubrobacter phytolaccae]|uniref:Uncharacterized protein n=1 Tax=Solirubrobacter phytolaccae TaxID=1404360 RepID=A0A9X3NFH7_9ACTN|nr:hypothetical protein [Solirubrobacter phytolaccae]MDA0183176.1 hypothetical protein [Solirubrobacter phytolaccae]